MTTLLMLLLTGLIGQAAVRTDNTLLGLLFVLAGCVTFERIDQQRAHRKKARARRPGAPPVTVTVTKDWFA